MASPSTTPNQPGTPEWTIGDRLRKARRVAELEAQDLAATIGVSRNTVSNYENDRVTPDRRTLIAWAFATGVPLAWIEGGTPEGSSPEEQSDMGRKGRRTSAGRLRSGVHSCWSIHHGPILVHPNLLGDSIPARRQAAPGCRLTALDTPCATATDLATCRSQAG